MRSRFVVSLSRLPEERRAGRVTSGRGLGKNRLGTHLGDLRDRRFARRRGGLLFFERHATLRRIERHVSRASAPRDRALHGRSHRRKHHVHGIVANARRECRSASDRRHAMGILCRRCKNPSHVQRRRDGHVFRSVIRCGRRVGVSRYARCRVPHRYLRVRWNNRSRRSR